jgi:uncharacterized protein (UPF0248 family)
LNLKETCLATGKLLFFLFNQYKVMKKHISIQLLEKLCSLMKGINKIPLFMKLSVFMLICFVGLVSANNSYAQKTLLHIVAQNQTVESVLNEIEHQSDYTFFYNNKQINIHRTVSVNAREKNIFNVLADVFKGTDVVYEVLDKSIILSNKALVEKWLIHPMNLLLGLMLLFKVLLPGL